MEAESESEIHSFEVELEDQRIRADKVIATRYPQFSRSQIQRILELGRVWRNDEAITKSDKLIQGDTITFSFPQIQTLSVNPVDIPLQILHETPDFIVINKAPGMVVHPGAGTDETTLVHALLFHCRGQLSGIGGVERPGIVHRLDKETSGVIVAAKTDVAFYALVKAFAERLTQKTYYAIVAGVPRRLAGWIKEPIGRHPTHRQKMAVNPKGREAISHYEVLKSFGKTAALLKVKILTGRTHQIRVHLSHLGHPLFGDETYGFKPLQYAVKVPRVMLHAGALVFPDPTNETAALTFNAPLPADFDEALNAFSQGLSAR
jgi:23S rRNA pseudouridine1911/1915/1917 synthase